MPSTTWIIPPSQKKVQCAFFYFTKNKHSFAWYCWFYFGKAVTFPCSICRRRNLLHAPSMESWWKRRHTAGWTEAQPWMHVSVLVDAERGYCMIPSMSYCMLHDLRVLQRTQEQVDYVTGVACACVFLIQQAGGEGQREGGHVGRWLYS